MRLGEVARGVRMTRVVRPDRIDAGDGLLDGAERDETLPGRVEVLGTGALGENRTPRGEIAEAPFAEPAAPGVDVHALGDQQLPGGFLDVAAIRLRHRRGGVRIGEDPALLLEQPDVGAVGWVD